MMVNLMLFASPVPSGRADQPDGREPPPATAWSESSPAEDCAEATGAFIEAIMTQAAIEAVRIVISLTRVAVVGPV
jgi:hypothetical protein